MIIPRLTKRCFSIKVFSVSNIIFSISILLEQSEFCRYTRVGANHPGVRHGRRGSFMYVLRLGACLKCPRASRRNGALVRGRNILPGCPAQFSSVQFVLDFRTPRCSPQPAEHVATRRCSSVSCFRESRVLQFQIIVHVHSLSQL